MSRSLLLVLPFVLACQGSIGELEDDTGDLVVDTGDTGEEIDPADFEEAILRIVEPASASFLPWGEQHHFQAELLDQDGLPLEFEEIQWTSSADSTWEGYGLDYFDGGLDVGRHDITALAYLPNDDRVAHTVGGILVQSPVAGTYVGLFISTVTYESVPVPCSGAATLVIDPYGDVATGGAVCVASLMGFEMEFNYVFELNNHGGHLTGNAGADILGMFQYDFETDGSLEGDSMSFSFGGDVMGMLDVAAEVRAEKISDDAGL